ncbi:unnamed protein product (macronuclear) [Paramecium tetraurelia]|uniref:RING-type domain-containing protein n=1 Tax=Paramecium tetraurelia TaxID=5888 RepID=A0C0T3_PARTE|nr:uncharacterized protein GSPATT00033876001 [Paramecium tetraurelia]CAK64400.1 unnamed protein product [Paramecium tetraurelia]|eukprot:XP_001431798.1 hypothetical protein (macronuclear) [Paramecium tetraurelia strain d4-2]
MQKIQFNCTICLNHLSDPTCLSCGHTFCEKCINHHLKLNHSCPLCRKPTLSEWPVNEMLKEVLLILFEQGPEGKLYLPIRHLVLQTEFPQIVLCLDCGLTPINPVVLPCQHLFCLQCYQNDLVQQYCPVCLQQCMITQPNINLLFNQFLQWYCETDEKFLLQDQQVHSMPIFLFDKQICYRRNFSLRIVEDRYKQLIKLASHGSGKFPVVPLTDQLPVYADMVEIVSITDQIEIVGCDRLLIDAIYCYINDEKIPFTPNTFKALPNQLWLCNYTLVKDNQDKSQVSNKIKQFIQVTFAELTEEMKSLFEKPYHLMGIFGTKFHQVNPSLIMIQLLKITNQQFQKLYYSNDEQLRNQFIWNFINQIQQKIIQIIGNQTQNAKLKQLNMDEEIQLPNLQFHNIYEEEEEGFSQDLNESFSNMTITQQIILNLFHLHKVPFFQ